MLFHNSLAVLDVRRSLSSIVSRDAVCLSFSMAATSIFAANFSANSRAFIFVPLSLKRLLSPTCATTALSLRLPNGNHDRPSSVLQS
jgi:hypothetical protein